jgi:hypothetical protein
MLTLVIILFFESSLLMYFQREKKNCSVQRVIVFGRLSLERFLTLSSTDFYLFFFCRPSLKGSEENMVVLTLNGSALSRLMMPSKLSFGNKQLQMFTWLVEEEYNFGMLHSSCLLHALSTTCFMLALEYLSHTSNYYQKISTYLGFMILSWKFQLCWRF